MISAKRMYNESYGKKEIESNCELYREKNSSNCTERIKC